MTDIDKKTWHHEESNQLRTARWLVSAKATSYIRSPHFWIICILWAAFAYIYYTVLSAYHDIFLVIFFYPLIYTAIVYRLRGVFIGGMVIIGILLPHVLLFYYDVYSLLRVLLFAASAFLIGGSGATLLNYLERQLEAYDEILSLNEELSGYIERLQSTQKQLLHSEKMNALGQLSAAIAHEINNPLAGVLVYCKLLMKKIGGGSFDGEEALASLSKIESAVSHCSRLVGGLLDFARQSEPVLRPVGVSGVIDQVIALVGHQAEIKHIEVVRDDAPSLPKVMADSGQLQQVFVNLTVNAIQAMPDKGRLTIRSSLDDNEWLKVSIQDTGCGIAPENMDRLFTPFFTTKEEIEGTGLGLAVSYGIIERHGGRIEAQSEVNKGSTFTVYLPVTTGKEGQAAELIMPSPP